MMCDDDFQLGWSTEDALFPQRDNPMPPAPCYRSAVWHLEFGRNCRCLQCSQGDAHALGDESFYYHGEF